MKKQVDPRIITTNSDKHYGQLSAKELEDAIKSAQAEEAKEQVRLEQEQSTNN